MSVECMAAVLHHSRAKGTAKLVLVGIANHQGDGGAWPALSTLAIYAGVSVRNVRKALRVLEGMGELWTDQRGGGTIETRDEMRPNLYRVQVECPTNCDRTTHHRTKQQRLNLIITDPRSEATGGVGSDRGAPVGGDRGEGSVATPEPSTNHQRNTGSSTSTNHRGSTSPVDNLCICQHGWLGEDAEGRRIPCLRCKPHLRSVVS